MPLSTPPPPTPVEIFSRAGITLYWGDSVTALPLLDFTADLIVTDPPYGYSRPSERKGVSDSHDKIIGNDSTQMALEVIGLCLPKLRLSRHTYLFGRYDLSGFPFSTPVELVWDKGNMSGGDIKSPWGLQHELIQFVVKKSGSKKAYKKNDGAVAARMRKGSVLRFSRPPAKNHPTEKPVPLLRELIESSSRFGELILDPFAGSGSTLEAAYLEGRQAIGIEIDLDYCDVADRRLSALIPPGTPAPERRS